MNLQTIVSRDLQTGYIHMYIFLYKSTCLCDFFFHLISNRQILIMTHARQSFARFLVYHEFGTILR